MRTIIFLVSFLIVGTYASGAEKVITGTYSNMNFNKLSGDLNGTEIKIVLGKGKYFAITQIAEGEPSEPIISSVLKLNDGRFQFEIPKGSFYEAVYTFSQTKSGISGEFQLPNGKKKSFSLERKKSYWD